MAPGDRVLELGQPSKMEVVNQAKKKPTHCVLVSFFLIVQV